MPAAYETPRATAIKRANAAPPISIIVSDFLSALKVEISANEMQTFV